MSEADTAASLAPAPLELLAGMGLGEHEDEEVVPEASVSVTPREALEVVVCEALARPPCLVGFSGGRDSSAILALATHVARREGLPLPVPTTYVFPGIQKADESSWQNVVVRHLDLPEWSHTVVTDQFDVLGPEATAVLRRHGALVPFTSHSQVPLLREARGGSLLTGFDGDGLFGAWRWERVASVLAGRERPRPRDVRGLALAAAPARARVAWMSRRSTFPPQPWLRPRVERAVRRAFAEERALEPRRWDRRVGWYARRRSVVLPRLTMGLLAEEVGAALRHPFMEPRFLGAIARAGGRSGAADRTQWMRLLFGDLLPPEVIERRDKADLEDAFWGEHSRRFVEEWDGSGLDESVVDVDELRAAWRTRQLSSVTLLQVVWLASAGIQSESGAMSAGLGAGR
jgi:hypothetical protein